MKMNLLSVEDWVQAKEGIATLIFDWADIAEDEEYVRPHEETCHKIAEAILERLNFTAFD